MGKKTEDLKYTPDEEKIINLIANELARFQSSVKIIGEVVRLSDFPEELEEGFVKTKKEFAWSRCEIKILEILAIHQGVPLEGAK
jgi:hypothetical protein